MRSLCLPGVLFCLASTGCKGTEEPDPNVGADVPAIGLRRLSTTEYQTTVHDLLGVQLDARSRLPEDSRDPFDNDYTLQSVGDVHIAGYEALAMQAAEQVLNDTAIRDQVIGCDPVEDARCISTFVERFGRRALRRPLSTDEASRLVGLAERLATEAGDPWVGPGIALRVLLQHTSFLYRAEVGEEGGEDGTLIALTDYEIATRMSYLLWGTTPDDALLDRAAQGGLADADTRAALATEMLGDARARDQINRFHALWLGYIFLDPNTGLSGQLRREADALVGDVVFDSERPYNELFTATQTFIEPELATHYGWTPPASADWVNFPEEGRFGLLGTGAFLAVAAKFGDTSPTQRGKLVRERLMCEIVLPPPTSVNADEPPVGTTSECKIDRYSEHRAGSCEGCHKDLDEVGFGLEAWDQAGRFREHDLGHPECAIDYGGDVVEIGPFRGPGELATLLLDNGVLDACAITQVQRYALGRKPRRADQARQDALTAQFRDSGQRFAPLLVDLVASPDFALRLADEVAQ